MHIQKIKIRCYSGSKWVTPSAYNQQAVRSLPILEKMMIKGSATQFWTGWMDDDKGHLSVTGTKEEMFSRQILIKIQEEFHFISFNPD